MISLIHRKAACSTDMSVQVSPPREDGEKALQLWLLCQGCYIVVLAAGLAWGKCFPSTWTEPLSLSHGQQKEGKLLANAYHGDGYEGLSGHFPLSSYLQSMPISVKPIFQSAFPVTGRAGPQEWEKRKSPPDFSAWTLLLPLLEAEDRHSWLGSSPETAGHSLCSCSHKML